MGPRRATSVLAWSLFALWAVVSSATAWIGMTADPIVSDSLFAVFTVGYSAMGALVASRHPGNAVGWLLLAIALTVALEGAGETYVSWHSPGFVAVAWVTGWVMNVWLFLSVAFLPLVFPTGRVLSPRWRPVWWFELVTMTSIIVMAGLLPGELDVETPVRNPLELQGAAAAALQAVNRWADLALLLCLALSALSLVVRFRRSSGAERQQLKWFASAIVLAAMGFAAAGVGPQLMNQTGWWLFLLAAVLGIPLATGIAVLRYRLYDIDLVINRTLVYGTLTAGLAMTYVVSILLLRLLLNPFTGETDLAVAGSTLVVAAAFRPARARIQASVDRRFYRRRYDAAHTLDEFSSRLRHELDLDAIGSDLRTTADQTMQPAHLSLWLRETRR